MYQNLPHELRSLTQWVTWRSEIPPGSDKPTKVPYSVFGGKSLSTDASTWGSFEMACTFAAKHGMSGIGFNLREGGEYTCIDLDDPYGLNPDGSPKHKDPAKVAALQQLVQQRFGNTYQEISPSGKGLHIWCKGTAPTGRRRNGIEMYSSERYMTMTGDVFVNAPIVECQEAINWLYDEMGGAAELAPVGVGDFVERYTDQQVVDKARNAANGEKFTDLAVGNWQAYYGSQSEADFALIDILAYYTQNIWQIARIFRYSALGQRDKAKRDSYVFNMARRALDRQPPAIDVEAMRIAVDNQFAAELNRAGVGTERQLASQPAPYVPQPQPLPLYAQPSDGNTEHMGAPEGVAAEPEAGNPYLRPVPGLLGDIARFIYEQAPRPVVEIALAGAIGLMSGICGRAFNVSGTGLNSYTLLLAPTGRGKEAINSGIAKLMGAVIHQDIGGVMGAAMFIGPSEIASGQALIKHLSGTANSFVSVVGEVDITLKKLTSNHANAAERMLKQVMLKAYSASGRGQTLGSMIYSDKDKNAAAVMSPAFSIIGEGTPDRFYDMLDEQLVSDGLLPRFTIIEYAGERVPLNRNAGNVQPSRELINNVATLCSSALMFNHKNNPLDVQLTPEALAFFHHFDVTVDGIMNNAHSHVINELWNRAYLKAIKIAALIAIGCNLHQPTITLEMADYAVAMVKHDTSRLVAKFKSGDIGDGFSKQVNDFKKAIRKCYAMPLARAEQNGMTWQMQQDRLIPHRVLQQVTANLASFKNDKMGAPRALDTVLRSMVDGGVLAQVGVGDLAKYGKDRGRYYVVSDATWLGDNSAD